MENDDRNRCEVCNQRHDPLPEVGPRQHRRYQEARERLIPVAQRMAGIRVSVIKGRRPMTEGESNARWNREFHDAMGTLAFLHGLIEHDPRKMPKARELSIGCVDEEHQEAAA